MATSLSLPQTRSLAGVIFDVDGVLLASPHERAWREALQELMATNWADVRPTTTYAPDRFTSRVYQELIAGRPRLSGAQAALTYFGVPKAEQRSIEYGARKQQRLMELIAAGEFAAFPDGTRFALALKTRGLQLAAASSSKNAAGLLQQIPLAPYLPENGPAPVVIGAATRLYDLFDVDVSGRDLLEGKPDPAIFVLAAKELGMPPDACLVVEDAPAGITAAKAGGMAALGIARTDDATVLGAAGADLVVSSLDEVDLAALVTGNLRARASNSNLLDSPPSCPQRLRDRTR
jgi:beta-phosphoglucomutase-like phosphatase (HAD superfamily)